MDIQLSQIHEWILKIDSMVTISAGYMYVFIQSIHFYILFSQIHEWINEIVWTPFQLDTRIDSYNVFMQIPFSARYMNRFINMDTHFSQIHVWIHEIGSMDSISVGYMNGFIMYLIKLNNSVLIPILKKIIVKIFLSSFIIIPPVDSSPEISKI